VERKIQTFYGKIIAIFNNGGREDSIRTGVWAEGVRPTTFFSNLTSIKAKDKCPYQLFLAEKLRLQQD
jgi:hypothetical protein